jgi:hypothetical protein
MDMPMICSQQQFRSASKPDFCYLCGDTLLSGRPTNRDHCPPKSWFDASDREDYPIVLEVHEACNNKWKLPDETMSGLFAAFHEGYAGRDLSRQRKPESLEIENDQGIYPAMTNVPFVPQSHRVIRCMHALLYGEFLPSQTGNWLHVPIPEVNPKDGNRPVRPELQTYAMANALCTAQKARTSDRVKAYGGSFEYVCTWTKTDNGKPMCIFAFDIHRVARAAVQIEDFPRAFIGFYFAPSPKLGSRCSDVLVENTDEEILYPILNIA